MLCGLAKIFLQVKIRLNQSQIIEKEIIFRRSILLLILKITRLVDWFIKGQKQVVLIHQEKYEIVSKFSQVFKNSYKTGLVVWITLKEREREREHKRSSTNYIITKWFFLQVNEINAKNVKSLNSHCEWRWVERSNKNTNRFSFVSFGAIF